MDPSVDFDDILAQIQTEIEPRLGEGQVDQTIPALSEIPPHQFGMAIYTVHGEHFEIGDAHVRFSIQSIAKVFSLTRAMQLSGDRLWSRLGREPSGGAFNSLLQLENHQGIPRNPFVNAGAIVIMDEIMRYGEGDLMPVIRDLAGEPSLLCDPIVADAERASGHRNRAMAHFLKSFGNLYNETDAVLDAYFDLCATSMNCRELARAFLYLANAGVGGEGALVTDSRQAKRINSVMLTCGVYDEAGDYAFRVGLPAKSGIGGGIVAVLPGEYVAVVWSPALSERGNSLLGTLALERLTTLTGRSIF